MAQEKEIVRAAGLRKRYRADGPDAVGGIDFAVREGEIFGLLGPNGAGKTTTIRMLATLLQPDAGSARVLGHDVVHEADAVRGKVSLIGQMASVDEDLTGRENLVLLGWLLGLKRRAAKARATELLEGFGLAEAAGRLVKNYSGGMRRRLDIAASIVAALAGIMLIATVGGFDPTASPSYLLPALAAVFLGTAVVMPGQFNPLGTLIGIYFLETGIIGLQLLGYSGWVQDAFYGAGLVAAVTVAHLVRNRTRVA